MFDAILIGLGKIGLGLGEYDAPWNSHLGSLLAAPWIDKIFVSDVDPEAIKKATARAAAIQPLDSYQGNSCNDILLVDASPPEGRLTRLASFASVYRPRLIFAEKPVFHEIDMDYEAYPWSITKINYPRARFESTSLLRDHLSGKVEKIFFRFSNGVENTLPHFLHLMSALGLADHNAILVPDGDRGARLGNIFIDYVDTNENIFDIRFETKYGVVNYENFGRALDFSGHRLCLDEIDSRFERIYDFYDSIAAMPSLQEDKYIFEMTMNVSQRIIA